MTKRLTTIPIEHKVIAILDNFQCALSEITLSNHLSIRHLDTLQEEERTEFEGEQRNERNVSMKMGETEYVNQTFHFVRYRAESGEVIERTVERGSHVLYWQFKERVPSPLKENYDFLLGPAREFDHVLSALRVLKEGIIGLFPEEHFLIQLPLPKEFQRATNRAMDGYQISKPFDVDAYILAPNDIETLKNLYNAIRGIKQSGLLTALSRLDNQYSRAYIADRIIDAVVALEALYGGDNTSELALRIGLRVSAHLGGSDADQREHYFDLFNLAYNLRSRLVHGSIYTTRDIDHETKKKGWSDHEKFMRDLDNMLRQALYGVLLKIGNKKLKEMLHEPLDRCIRRGEAFLLDTPAPPTN